MLIEVYSGRIPLPARVGGTAEEVEAALNKMVTSKLAGLQKRVADVLEGLLVPHGMPASGPLRVFPVLVHARRGCASDADSVALDRRAPRARGAFGDPRVAPPTICDLDDLEPLLALVEHGHTLPRGIADLNSSRYAAMPPRNWIAAVHKLTVDTRPRYVDAGFRRAMRDVHQRLFPDPTRFDDLWSRGEPPGG